MLDTIEALDHGDVDERARLHDVELHQVENGRAAREELRLGGRRGPLGGAEETHRRVCAVGPDIGERLHHALRIAGLACRTAATMLG